MKKTVTITLEMVEREYHITKDALNCMENNPEDGNYESSDYASVQDSLVEGE
jgi:hypothetical protein